MHPHPTALLWLLLLTLPLVVEAAPTGLDPTTVARTGRPNDRLICPPGACAAPADATAPVLDVTPQELLARWRQVIEAQPRTTILEVDAQGLRIVAEQRSRLMGFVDTIAIKALPLPDGRTSFAAYSRSETGYWDLGVNAARLEAWIGALVQGDPTAAR